MKVFFLGAVAWAVILANPLDPTKGTHELNIVFLYNKITSKASITAWNKDRTEILGHSCSHFLDSGNFQNHPVSFEVHQNGAGNITINHQTYLVHQDADILGGTSCGRMHSSTESLVTFFYPFEDMQVK
ncbi:hypothetical protein B0T17DRAFT_264030 [Bombardia bombarda]|uniref:Uncharacterized protein n=1 Tax=Bombardia bombarda TaxID=252184 RepID=A0AA40C4X5_9PEZI|nr:hypothetical protein B0T17DRAFT_264030 [Bombardia bombarda]